MPSKTMLKTHLIRCFLRQSSALVFLSVIMAALPAKSATLGALSAGLEPADMYQEIYSATAPTTLGSDGSDSIDAYQVAITQATTSNTPYVDTPLEESFAAAGYDPVILRRVVAKVVERASRPSQEAVDEFSLSGFDFESDQLVSFIGASEASTLYNWKDRRKCNNRRAKLNQKPGRLRSAQQTKSKIAGVAACWTR
jgi:hypothetical protein